MKCPHCHAAISWLAYGSVTCPYCGYQDHVSPQYLHQLLGKHALKPEESTPVRPKSFLHKHRHHAPKAAVAAIFLATAVSTLLIVSAFRTPYIKTANVGLVNTPSKPINEVLTKPQDTSTKPPTTDPTPTPPPTPPHVVAAPKPAAPPVATPPPATIPNPPDCTKLSFTPAAALTISTASPGLKKTIDTPKYYKVNGYTPDQVRTQINQCRPTVGATSPYDAGVYWWINYSYLYDTDSNGKCYLRNVAVGLHINSYLPEWQPSAYDISGLSAKWQNYIASLKTHEQGHKDLDIQYAEQILNGLKNLPHSSCSTIVKTANKFADDKIAALKAANSSYDSQTNHGATQGATFP
jgi:predicted secreted Zn-dependent protease